MKSERATGGGVGLRTAWGAAVLVGLAGASWGLAQPTAGGDGGAPHAAPTAAVRTEANAAETVEGSAAAPVESREGPAGGMSVEAARARLERRAEWLIAQQERIAEAMGKLDAGADPAAVLAEARVLGGPGAGMGGGAGGGAGEAAGAGAGQGQGRGDVRAAWMGNRRGPGAAASDGHTNGGPFGRGDRRVSAEEAMAGVDPERVRRSIREHMPELADKIETLRAKDPEAARMLEGRVRGVLLGVIESRLAGDDEMEKLRVGELRSGVRALEVMGRVREAGEASEADRAELAAALTEQHELRERIALLEVERLEARIGELREAAAARSADRAGQVAELVERMIARAVGAGG